MGTFFNSFPAIIMDSTEVTKHIHGTNAKLMDKNLFSPQECFYPKVLNATIHPLVSSFLKMSNDRIIERFCHLNPFVDRKTLEQLLTKYESAHFRWAGCDLFNVISSDSKRVMVVGETNSCPSGQKVRPLVNDDNEHGGYLDLLQNTFLPLIKQSPIPPSEGCVCVLYDKNLMEAHGYSYSLSELLNEPVYLVPWFKNDSDPPAKFDDDGVLHIRKPDGSWTKC